jgi:hypothetical protein
MHGSRNKIPSKKSRQAVLRGGINSSVKGLTNDKANGQTHDNLLSTTL